LSVLWLMCGDYKIGRYFGWWGIMFN